MADQYDLIRFVDAQRPVYDRVLAELRRGNKSGHWMWFVFPQLKGLGNSATATHYAISSLDEAAAYLAHPTLGARLRECTQLVIGTEGRTIRDIFGTPDDLKFRSCMTLFAHATTDNDDFEAALQKYFSGDYDQLTLQHL